MNNSKIKLAIAAVMSMGLSCAASADPASALPAGDMGASIPGMEKCYGIAKKGMNDCGNANHQCAGESKADGAKNEWLNVPTGLCSRIVGGSTKEGK